MPFWPFKKKCIANEALNWVTTHLAAGHAPMSYDQLDRLKAAGVNCILNLCAEFPDLPLIEQKAGFEVYYLPVDDDETPEMEAMDQALEWMDESIYLGKKVLVHCRHGIGRTGTLISAYLLRKGLSANMVQKQLKKLRSKPASYCQWQLLRKYGKKQGRLTLREPTLENKHSVDLNPFFEDLETIFTQVDLEIAEIDGLCGRDHSRCCRRPVQVSFVEAVYLAHNLNTRLSREKRQACISQAMEVFQTRQSFGQGVVSLEENLLCPLNDQNKCTFFDYRPLACRLVDYKHLPKKEKQKLQQDTQTISENLFLAFSGQFMHKSFSFDLNQVVSGKYVQEFFHVLMKG